MLFSRNQKFDKVAVFFCLTFLVLGMIWSTVLPIWEGFDEPAHYAFIQYFSENGKLPVYGESTFSKEIFFTYNVLPLNYNLKQDTKISNQTQLEGYEQYWTSFNETKYMKNYETLLNLPHSLRVQPEIGSNIYEAQQPPLYYSMMTLVYNSLQEN